MHGTTTAAAGISPRAKRAVYAILTAALLAAAAIEIAQGGPLHRDQGAVAVQALARQAALEAAVISAGFEELAAAFDAADGLGGIARTYRAFAHDHPHLYRLMTERPLDRGRLAAGVEVRAAAAILHAVDGDEDRARAAWALPTG